jgi:hypothetical protein
LSRNAHANKTVLRKVTGPLALPTAKTRVRQDEQGLTYCETMEQLSFHN